MVVLVEYVFSLSSGWLIFTSLDLGPLLFFLTEANLLLTVTAGLFVFAFVSFVIAKRVYKIV